MVNISNPHPSPHAYLTLCVLNLQHHNTAFPNLTLIITLVTQIYESLMLLPAPPCTPREALTMALDNRPILHNQLVIDIVQLCGLKGKASRGKIAENYITVALAESARFRMARSGLFLSDDSVDFTRPRCREDSSSRQGAPKRAPLRSTSDSDPTNPPPRRPSRKEKYHQHIREASTPSNQLYP